MSDDDNYILCKDVQDQIYGLATVSQYPYCNSISKGTCDRKEIEFINYNLVPDQTVFITVIKFQNISLWVNQVLVGERIQNNRNVLVDEETL